eukprot:TRINITY_DN1646_c0_g1_i2.p2 TRINITY_DN1646_c0_g1~~TRINITY_DN1646_c0_g1_i2.p2  ORF type:complete len:112 (+),score=23.12 TRINITY_DN1646_c0_g1_i2:720-1055(+)
MVRAASRPGSLIMFDSVGPLLTAVGSGPVADLMHYCRALAKATSCTLVVQAHDAAAACAHAADIRLRLEPLESGYAPDVDGQLSAVYDSDLLGQPNRSWRYRLSETGCRFL